MKKVAWKCINCLCIFNPGPETIEEEEYFLIDISKTFVCDECAHIDYWWRIALNK